MNRVSNASVIRRKNFKFMPRVPAEQHRGVHQILLHHGSEDFRDSVLAAPCEQGFQQKSADSTLAVVCRSDAWMPFGNQTAQREPPRQYGGLNLHIAKQDMVVFLNHSGELSNFGIAVHNPQADQGTAYILIQIQPIKGWLFGDSNFPYVESHPRNTFARCQAR